MSRIVRYSATAAAASRPGSTLVLPGLAISVRRGRTGGHRLPGFCGEVRAPVVRPAADEELLTGKPRDDLRALGGDDHLLLDARGAAPVLRRAVGLEGEHHAGLDL